MRLLRLEVQNFRGVRSAALDFGPGLNVLHGPNELGKSTLVEAIRAALLVPKSKIAEGFLRWDGATPTQVTLTFEAGSKVWRVRKKFDHAFNAVLEQAGSPSDRFREVANGRAVDDKLRELLRWGIASPGGKGAPAKPTSYLVVALLGRQGEVQEILDASLVKDQNETGKVSITDALGALGTDPRVMEVVERLSSRVETIFTPTGRLKQTGPIAELKEKVSAAEAALARLGEDDARSKSIGVEVVRLQAEWLQRSADLKEAEAVLELARHQQEQANKRQALQAVIDECRAKLGHAEELDHRLKGLRDALAGAEKDGAARQAGLTACRVSLETVTAQLQEASQAVVRGEAARDQAALEDQSNRQQQRTVLTEKKAGAEALLKDVEAAEREVRRLANAETSEQNASTLATTAQGQLRQAALALDHAKWSAERGELLGRDANAHELMDAIDAAGLREQQTGTALTQAEQAVAEATSYRDGQDWRSSQAIKELEAELARLQAVDLRLRVEDLERRIRECDAHEASHKGKLESARQKREQASGLEQQVATSTLPTEEQVATWRGWQAELESAPVEAAGSFSTGAMASLVGLGAGAAASLLVLLTNAGSAAIAVAVGLVAALLAGALTWSRGSARERVSAATRERRRLLEERWGKEVQPALRRAGVTQLAEIQRVRRELERMRIEAADLRLDAEQDEAEAARAAVQAAPLDGLRHELADLSTQDGQVDVGEISALLDDCRTRGVSPRALIDGCRARLEVASVELAKAAGVAVDIARRIADEKKALHGRAVQDAADARAAYDVARRGCDPDRVTKLESLIRDAGLSAVQPIAVDLAAARHEQARNSADEAVATAKAWQQQVSQLRPVVQQLLTALGKAPEIARRKAEAELAEIDARLAALIRPSGDVIADALNALAAAIQRRGDVAEQHQKVKAAVDEAVAMAGAAADAISEIKKEIASAEGELKAIDRAGLKAQLDAANQDPSFEEPDAVGPAVGDAAEAHRVARARLSVCEGRLNEAKGQLHLVGGHVVAERLARQEEVVTFARQEYEEKELVEWAALRLLREIKAAEAEVTSHLGRSMAGPVTKMLEELTGGHYGAVEFTTELVAGKVVAAGAPRDLSDLSVGTREQLATLIRLAIAAQLQTSLVLDDQLVHSDTGRLSWFRERLRTSAHDHQHQVVVFTCRPGDYVSAEASDEECSVNVVDLRAVVS